MEDIIKRIVGNENITEEDLFKNGLDLNLKTLYLPERYKNGGIRLMQLPKEFISLLTYLKQYSAANIISAYIEIGCYHGGSFIYIDSALRLSNPQMSSLAIDISPEPTWFWQYSQGKETKWLQHDSVELPNNALSIAENKLDNEVNIFFIDGNHSLKGVQNDFQLALDSRADLVILHDIVFDDGEKCEVPIFYKELKEAEKYEIIEFIDNDVPRRLGIGVVKTTRAPA